jgi:subtilase family serine protease/flagellar hook assembly protein FlgD/WD40 repeat protein
MRSTTRLWDRRARTLRVWVSALLLLPSVTGAGASVNAGADTALHADAGDELAASRRLRERAHTLRALPAPSAITRDQGDLAIVEHDGSNYSWRDPDGTPNYTPRAALARRFYATHGDFYDFLVVFTNFEFETGPAIAFHNLVRNDVQGIGKPVVDNGDLFGSPGRLKGYVDMAALTRYTTQPLSARPGVPLSVTPGQRGFRDTLNVLAHEIAHQWLAQPRFRDANGLLSSDLLGRDGAHWSYLLDSDASVMYGADWSPRGSQWRAERVFEQYSPLDLYLMGLRAPATVAPFTLLRNPNVDATQLPREFALVDANPETVTVDQVIAAEGARNPGFQAAPKTFRAGFIFLTAPGVEPSAEDLANVDRLRRAFAAHFFTLTNGVGLIDTTLAEAPTPAPAPVPNLDLALAWLLAHQDADGRFADVDGSGPRDTATVATLLRDRALSDASQRALDWLRAATLTNTDFLARRAAALAPDLDASAKADLLRVLVGRQNRDGGFGAAPGYQSDPLDTALALRALAALGAPGDASVTRALVHLRATRRSDGGWAAVPGGETSNVVSAQVILALEDYASHPTSSSMLDSAVAALAERHNPDGGFGESPSTPYATALVLQALLRGSAPAEVIEPAIAWLQRTQAVNGSWDDSRYATALVLAALDSGVTANLVVPPDTLVLTPPSVEEGQTVHVSARIRNTGRRAAPATKARLFDGNPAEPANAVGEQDVPALEPGDEALVEFDFPTQDKAGQHTLYVVADADREVSEAREYDNAASRALRVSGRLPDLTFLPGDMQVTPYPPEAGESVDVGVTVRNVGEQVARDNRLLLFRGNPRQGGVQIGQVSLPALGVGQSLTLTMPWDTTGQSGNHTLYVVADPDYRVDERDETNNELALPVRVAEQIPPGPDLEIAQVALAPAVLSTLPQALVARVVVRNVSREALASTVALYDGDGGPLLGELPVALAARTSTTLVFPVTIPGSGDRVLVALADPAGTLTEPDETNNRGQAALDDPENTVDLEILPTDVVPDTNDLLVGETLTVTVQVRNHGTAAVTNLPLLLAHASGATPPELARTFVDVPAGGSVTATLTWRTSILGAAVPLAVLADPFNLLSELNEANNRVDFTVAVRASDLPNLAVSGADLTLVPDPPQEGAPATVSVIVRNPGAVAAGPFDVRFYRGDPDEDGQLIGSATVPGLAAGAQATPSVVWPDVNVRGLQGLFALVDPDDQVEEYDETDNRAFRPFSSVGLPDIVIAAADLSLSPNFPRAGQAVTLAAVVRNLGGQPALATSLRLVEGEPAAGTLIAELSVPALAPGQAVTLSTPWTPAAPPGERTLSAVLDQDDVVREQDEGNNVARRRVVVQDADLYLTEPYFSPDGDGTKDETALAWRVVGFESVTVVVASARGKRIRTLVTGAPLEGSAAWDGRDENGRLMWDGIYTISLLADTDELLGRREVVLDTDHSSIQDAAGTGLTAVRNLTCGLPEIGRGPAWSPAEDEAYFILDQPSTNLAGSPTEFEPGLLRVALDGTRTYVGDPDPWWVEAHFPFGNYNDEPSSPAPMLVSPDGRELLVMQSDTLWAVDLVSAARRVLATNVGRWMRASWSPDGTRFVVGERSFRRDGTLEGYLYSGRGDHWIWSPDGRYLASGNVILLPDGEFWDELPLPGEIGGGESSFRYTDWLGDGRLFARFQSFGCGECDASTSAPAVPSASTRAQREAAWKARRDRAASQARVAPQEPARNPKTGRPEYVGGAPGSSVARGSGGGNSFLLLDPEDEDASKRLTWLEQLADQRSVYDHDFSPDGVKLLFQSYDSLGDYSRVAREDGQALRQLIRRPVTTSPRDAVASWRSWASVDVCEGQSEYFALLNLLNLTVDLQVSRLPANNGLRLRGTASDGHLDHWQLDYALESLPGVWHPLGPASDEPVIDDDFTVWVPDRPGRYLVRLRVLDRAGNERSRTRVVNWNLAPAIVNVTQSEFLISPNGDGRKDFVRFNYLVQEPARLEVRVAGPERPTAVAPVVRRLSFEYPQIGPAFFDWDGRDEAGQVVPDGRYTVYLNELPFRVKVDNTPPDLAWSEGPAVLKTRTPPPPAAPFGVVEAALGWHVVDPQLKSWLAPEGAGVEAIFDPERDAQGNILFDERGAPRVRYEQGRPANVQELLTITANVERTFFEADDRAANVAHANVPAREEKLYFLNGIDVDKRPVMLPPRMPEVVTALKPPMLRFLLVSTAFRRDAPVFFRFQRRSGGAFIEVPAALTWNAVFRDIGVQFGIEYNAEFVQRLPDGRELRTDTFAFRLCDGSAVLDVTAGPRQGELVQYHVDLDIVVGEPLESVTLSVRGGGPLSGFSATQPMTLSAPDQYATSVFAPGVSCERPRETLSFAAVARGISGRYYTSDANCLKMAISFPRCPNLVELEQAFPGCAGDPDRGLLEVVSRTEVPGARVIVETGPENAPVTVAELPIGRSLLPWDFNGLAQGSVPVRARLTAPTEPEPLASAATDLIIDRTPPEAEILEPVEGGTLCVARDPQTGAELARLTYEMDDAYEPLWLGAASSQHDEDPIRTLLLRCGPSGQCPYQEQPRAQPLEFLWDVTREPSGPYTIQQQFCDRSGNKVQVTRHLELSKLPPYLRVENVSRRVFSPNADGRADDTTFVLRLIQALRLTVAIHAGDPSGPLVRHLTTNSTYVAGSHPFTWDGQDDNGTPLTDGDYYLVASGRDACGGIGSVNSRVEIDNTPPEALVLVPSTGATLSSSVVVAGRTRDLHFDNYELSWGAGVAPSDWTLLQRGFGPVALPPVTSAPLGQWTPPHVPGPAPEPFVLRLVSTDHAENVTEVLVPVEVGPRTFLDYLRVDPLLFSPNGDERLDTTIIDYGLLLPAQVTLEVRTLAGIPVRRIEDQVVRPAGVYPFEWNGLDDFGNPAPEGELLAHVRAEDTGGSGSAQEQDVLFVLDRTPPALAIAAPSEDAYVDRRAVVRGSVSDERLTTWRLEAVSQDASATLLEQGSEPRNNSLLATLDALEDGPYTLAFVASDAAQNEATLTRRVTVDSIAPQVHLAQAAGAVLLKGDTPIRVEGSATDLNLREYVLSFGPGDNPGYFTEIARSSQGGEGITLGQWAVANLPDGVYTLRLEAVDKAEHSADTQVTVVLDGTPPVAAIASPLENAWVTAPMPLTGTAADANIANWKLEVAPGPAAQAYQFAPLAEGEEAVGPEGELANWSPLPADGVQTLRLTVTDKVGLSARALRTVIVDTTPPAAPTGLVAEVTRRSDTEGDVRLTWDPNSEPDLAGYRVYRDGQELTPETIPNPLQFDPALEDGVYTYEVEALDQAGNVSPRTPLRVRVDLTPPLVDILRPLTGARVSGSVDIRGTAFSVDDFKEWRLYVGAGASPGSFTLLKRATVPVSAGNLAQWLAVGDGPHVIALEAEDNTGNQARATVTVVVDNDAPSAPVLVSVPNVPAPDALTPTWTPSPETDVAGYLVFRNGRITNAPGVVVGDPRAFLVPPPAYADTSLPDGEHCYRVVAMDEAGNQSAPSNEICVTLDNRAPHAVLVEPTNGLRFDYPLHLLAFTPDLDIAAVQLQWKPDAEATWRDLGAADVAAPYEAMFDPAALEPGPYNLRAVARDTGGRVDPDPEAITVIYGDATAPPTPPQVRTQVDGVDVKVTWQAVNATDLAGYNVYRDDELITPAPITETTLDDLDLDLGPYRYSVTAVDEDGNESGPGSADALVYRLELEQPYPVVNLGATSLRGDGAQANTTIDVLDDDDTVLASGAAASAGPYDVAGVPLVLGGNLLHTVGSDIAGNRSVASPAIVVIANDPPPAVTGAAATVNGRDVALTWDPVSDPELVGYVVRRGNERLTLGAAQTQAASLQASSTYPCCGFSPAAAFDGNSSTAWIPATIPADWTITFPSAVPVESVRLTFNNFGSPTSASAYRVEALWEGRFLPLVRVTGNQQVSVEHVLPAPFTTTALRVTMETDFYTGLSEVQVRRAGVVPAGTTNYDDLLVADGTQIYRVTALDRYGAEGPAGTATAPVGNTTPPSKPTGLQATVFDNDVLLTWNANPEPDVVRYVVLRDGVRIATVPTPTHRDVGRPNGTYVYTVIAVDIEGLESEPSDPAEALVNRTVPPATPVITVPTDAAHPLTLQGLLTPVRGESDAGTLVSLRVNGVLTDATDASAAFAPQGVWSPPPSSSGEVTLSADGRYAATGAYEAFGSRLRIADLHGGGTRDYGVPSYSSFSLGTFSNDGNRIAWAHGGRVFVLERTTGVISEVPVEPYYAQEAVLSADGTRVAYTGYRYFFGYQYVLATYPLPGGPARIYSSGSTSYFKPRLSPDGSRLAVYNYSNSTFRYELRVFDTASGVSTRPDGDVWPNAAAEFSSDGTQLVYTGRAPLAEQIRLYNLGTGTVVGLTDGVTAAYDPHFDRRGDWLSFLRVEQEGSPLQGALMALPRAGGPAQRVAGFQSYGHEPRSVHAWDTRGYLHAALDERVRVFAGFEGSFSFDAVRLQPGLNSVTARAFDRLTGLSSAESEAVLLDVQGVSLPDLAVSAADLSVYPQLPLVGQATRADVRVRNLGSEDAWGTTLHVRIEDPGAATVFDQVLDLPYIYAGDTAVLPVYFTPDVPGRHTLHVQVDEPGLLLESDESNNLAARDVLVAQQGGLLAELSADRDRYPARSGATLLVQVTNAGDAFSGSARLTVETAAGEEVAELDTRALALVYGASSSYSVAWNTGNTYAGDYRFVLRITADGASAPTSEVLRAFTILPDRRVTASLSPERSPVRLGEEARFTARVDNLGANLPLDDLVARLRLLPTGGGAAVFTLDRALPRLLPGGGWQATLTWPAAGPAGSYTAELLVLHASETDARAEAPFAVVAPSVSLTGSLQLEPADVMVGQGTQARVSLTNRGSAALDAHPFAVELAAGPSATIVARVAFSASLAVGETQTLVLPLDTSALAPGLYPAFLRSLAPSTQSLARARFGVHGLLTPPSIEAPPDGARVATGHPTLVLNNGQSPEGLPLTYEFELYADAALTVPVPGTRGVPETPLRTQWTVVTNLVEDQTYWWRARAHDGFSASAWTSVSSFTVDQGNEPPFAPIPDTPAPGARVATRDVTLVVRNARDPEFDTLVYDFRLASDPAMSSIVASINGVSEGPGTTPWHLPSLLDEDATYWWQSRARDALGASPWFDPVAFTVDSFNASPSAPTPLRPIDGVTVTTLSPELAVGPASDPEHDPLTYTFQLDRVPSFDSPALQVSPALPQGATETVFTAANALTDNTRYYWRAAANDGHTSGPWAGSDFFVNLGNDAPTAPVALQPPDGGIVTSPTPTLRVRNATDADGDALTYAFEVRDALDAVVVSIAGVPETVAETAWPVAIALTENATFTWRARAFDGQVFGPWSTPSSFRVNAQPDPPTAPGLIAPTEGATVALRRPALVVSNATSPEGLALVYTFELYRVGAGGVLTLVDQASGVPEGAAGQTTFNPGLDLADGSYSWRARAVDVNQAGPWMNSAHFSVQVDVPPAPPTGLVAAPGDARVTLNWNASPEPDVVGYRVYRSLTAGGPYAALASTTAPTYLDLAVVNGTTYHYVVTARDAAFESGFSLEAAATPRASGVIAAEVRIKPASLSATCLLCRCKHKTDDGGWKGEDECGKDDDLVKRLLAPKPPVSLLDADEDGESALPSGERPDVGPIDTEGYRDPKKCPEWIKVQIELPPGYDPAAIERSSVLLNGDVAPDAESWALVDRDEDGILELELRFRLELVAPLLSVGSPTLTVTGRIGASTFSGQAQITVPSPALTAWFTPRTLKKSASGQWVQVKLSFEDCGRAGDIDTTSIRLNGVVPVARVVSRPGDYDLIVKFDRAAVAAILPVGNRVEIRITGTVRTMPFLAIDTIRVTP